MVKYNRQENRFIEPENEASLWKKTLLLGATLFVTFFWLFPIGLKTITHFIMKSGEPEHATNAIQKIAEGMNGIVDVVVNFAVYGLKIFAVVLLITCIAKATTGYINKK